MRFQANAIAPIAVQKRGGLAIKLQSFPTNDAYWHFRAVLRGGGGPHHLGIVELDWPLPPDRGLLDSPGVSAPAGVVRQPQVALNLDYYIASRQAFQIAERRCNS